MNGAVDLSPAYMEMVKGILAEHVPGCEVRAFGSRATWTAKEYSDLDIAVVGGEPLDWRVLGRLREAFEESNLPMRVDVLNWHSISESFQKVIEVGYVVLQEGSRGAAANGWREVTLGDVCTKIGSGATPRGGKDAYVQDGPYALIRSQNVYNSGFSNGGLAFITDEQAEALRNVEVLPEDVLLNITGDSVARVCQVDAAVLPARVNQHVAIVRPDPDSLDPEYLRYYLVMPEVQATLLSWAGSGGTRNALTKKMIESFVVRAPNDVDEQRAIAHVLGTLDDKIELNRRMNETLEEMARALFKSWFVDFEPVRAKMEGRWRRGESLPGLPAELYDLFPDRLAPSELGDIPEGWEVRRLGDVVELAYGKALRAVDRRGGSVPVYGSNGRVGWHDKELVSGPGIIVGRKGNPGIVTWTHGDFFPIDTTFYVVPRDSEFGMHFLFYALTHQNLPSVSADSAVPGLNRNLAYMNSQLVPGRQLADAFNDLVEAYFKQSQQFEIESMTLAAQRDALLPGLVSGEVRV